MIPAWLNVSTRKVGGLRFVKVGRLTVSWSVSRAYRPIGAPAVPSFTMPIEVRFPAPDLTALRAARAARSLAR